MVSCVFRGVKIVAYSKPYNRCKLESCTSKPQNALFYQWRSLFRFISLTN